MRAHRDLSITVGAAAVAAALALFFPLEVVRLLAAVPLCLLLPGYAITSALFARRRLAVPQTLMLSLALSLSSLALGALLLNYMPGGLRAGTWVVLILLVIVGACLFAANRRGVAQAEELPRLRLKLSRLDWGLIAGGAAAVIVALTLSSTILPAHNAVGYTQLWLVPQTGAKGSAPEVGVRSQEQDAVLYRLVVRVGKGREPLETQLVLEPGQSRVFDIPSVGANRARAAPVTAVLYRAEHPFSAYRKVSGWIAGSEGRS